ncbi:MAG: hypothetical protein ACON5K_01290 [Bacteroidia bacterium]
MVTIVNFEKRQSKTGNEFFALILQGGVEMVRSVETGQFYATVKKCSVPSTLDEESCKMMLGSQLEGNIQKTSCEPYEYTVPETGEVIELSHRWTFVPENEAAKKQATASTPEFGTLEELMA